jgi:hypothetical protein
MMSPASSEIANRFSAHIFRPGNSNGLLGTSLDWPIALERA